MTAAEAVETSVITTNSLSEDYTNLDDHISQTSIDTRRFKSFTLKHNTSRLEGRFRNTIIICHHLTSTFHDNSHVHYYPFTYALQTLISRSNMQLIILYCVCRPIVITAFDQYFQPDFHHWTFSRRMYALRTYVL